ncbi:MAG: glycine--tRNA ligase [Kiritimatiellaceae bacterium]|jgi:glycyl-tRNA synthetase|nr:glycine--tRNA ligase [Kiritimatiellaceae bacterium]|tara:strand:+ start:265 stop:1803 length:1539 start_codon:yes stop_codon:yes gene_type:complete
MKPNDYKVTMDALVSLCKRRGFIFQTSEIYGGINGFWDYGPLGVEMKRNIKACWWKSMTQLREDIVGLDSSIIMHPRVWEASGHVGNFKDPMLDCRETKGRYRADQLFALRHKQDKNALMFVHHEGAPAPAEKKIKKIAKNDASDYESVALLDIPLDAYDRLVGPDTNEPGSLTEPRAFNLMFKTFVGPVEESSNVAYLRPETAQGIFAQFGNVLSTVRNKVPFGIAQIGKAFRNEINPRNYTFRSREFEQMELEYFIKPGTDAEMHEYWVAERLKWYEKVGLPEGRMQREIHEDNELAHYASACTDILYEFPFGTQELEGIAARGNFDLTQHQETSGKKLEYQDEETQEKYLPHVIEPSAGVDRIALALLCEAYREEWIPKGGGDVLTAEPDAKRAPEGYEARTVLRFAPCIAPYKAAILPLVKNKEPLVEKARELYEQLSKRWKCFYDQNGAIGRRYRRQDEIGTPLCITIDFETIEQDDCVTIRDRDTMQQVRVSICELEAFITERVDF